MQYNLTHLEAQTLTPNFRIAFYVIRMARALISNVYIYIHMCS